MKDLGRRLVVSTISIVLIVLLLTFAYVRNIQSVLALVLGLLSAVATWEYIQFAKERGIRVQTGLMIAFSLLLTISFLGRSPGTIFFIGTILLFAFHFRAKDGAIVDLAVSLFALVYIAVPLGMILKTLYFPFVDGRLWVAYLLAVTKITDIGGYFGGHFFGRRKLAPHISPGKTVEGAICGLISALLVSYLFHLLGVVGQLEWIGLGLGLGCIGQFGDLAESLLKRDANLKDSNALPGLGGVLDMVDALLFSAPLLYFYLTVFRGFV